MQSLFLQQSYLDTWGDYLRSLRHASYPVWDYVILTASNRAQADAYGLQIRHRQAAGLLPDRTRFVVLPDPGDTRVGSGGATLHALHYVHEQAHTLHGLRVLVIHSGGDSKRVPQYSACGKLFSPVPRELPNGKRSTLFDELIIGMSGVPARIKEGMLVLSGDVLLLFNPLQIDAPVSGAAAISFKEDVDTGKDHGVYLIDKDGNVGAFLHKQSIETLHSRGAVNASGRVDIDTGAVLFAPDVMDTLYGLVDTPEKFQACVNDRARLSFYGDFLYPLASCSTLEQFYLEKPEGAFTPELKSCRIAIWNALRKYQMRLLRLAPAAFIHFGTTRELKELMTKKVSDYHFLGWQKQVSTIRQSASYAANNTVVDSNSSIGDDCYLEDCDIENSRIGAGSVLSHVTVKERSIPENVTLHTLKLTSGRFVTRIYGIDDNPKDTLTNDGRLLEQPLRVAVERIGSARDIWATDDHSLWNAKIYPICDSVGASVDAALLLYQMLNENVSVEKKAEFLATPRLSLSESFHLADNEAILAWETHVSEAIMVERLCMLIQSGGTVDASIALCRNASVSAHQLQLWEKKALQADFSTQMRIYYFLGRILEQMPESSPAASMSEDYIRRAFRAIYDHVLSGTPGMAKPIRPVANAVHTNTTVRLPLRVNFGGGWSDTPPYCNEHGGAVLNAAILLCGMEPVEVQVRHVDERKIILESADIGVYGEFTSLSDLQNCNNPFDSFALHKAALIACGVLPASGGSMEEVFDRTLAGGLYLSTQVHNVPKGSGLGTSSILAGACVKALFQYFGRDFAESDLYDRVMCMEQIMSTGGGWQDQVGGLTNGFKFTTSQPGAKQALQVRRLHLRPETMAELDARFCLIYTGQRRLARNLLRDVVGRYIGNTPESLAALEAIQRSAAQMAHALEQGNVDRFARLLDAHWELSKQVDAGSTNTCIDQIFLSIADLIDAKMICGAGGGGFLQVIMKKGVTKAQLHTRLYEIFQDCGVDVWDSRFAW